MTTSRINRDRCRLGITCAAAISAGFAPLAVQAEEANLRELTRPSSEVEVGVGYVDRSSFKFGDYNGLHREGAFVIGHFDLTGQPEGTARYWTFSGTNIGLNSRHLRFDFSEQGNYRFFLEYDQLPKLRSDTARTPFLGAGSDTLTLPAPWVPAATTAGMTQLGANLRNVDIGHTRKNYSVGASKLFGTNWDASARFRHETREGTKLTGGVIGNSGGNPRAVIIPEPIDYETNEFEAMVSYAAAKWQLRVGYFLSLFNNENQGLTWQNPFSTIAGWAAGVGHPTGRGRLGLPPDNQFHQITVNGGYNIGTTTRLMGNVAVGRMLQNETFLPYTVNPFLLAPTPLPRQSLDGRIDTTLVNLSMSSRPLTGLSVRASYRFDDRDNKTPQAQYLYIGGDSQNQQTVATDRARTNLPISYRQHLVKAEADYEFLPRTRVTGGYHYEQVHRTFTEVDKVREHTVLAGVRRSMAEYLDGAVTYARSERRNTGYAGTAPFLASYSPQFVATMTPATQWDNNPLIRKFTYADRDRDKLRLTLNATPFERVGLHFSADYNKDDYANSILGLQQSRSQSYTADVAFTPVTNVTLHAFYTYDKIDSDQRGRQFAAAAKALEGTRPVSPNDWFTSMQDRIDTLGVGATVKALARWDLNANYTYSDGRGSINTITGPGIAVPGIPMPDTVSRLHSLRLSAGYAVKKDVTVRLSWWHERLRTRDWAYDNVTPTTLANVLTTGHQSPNYSVNVFGVSLRVRYW